MQRCIRYGPGLLREAVPVAMSITVGESEPSLVPAVWWALVLSSGPRQSTTPSFLLRTMRSVILGLSTSWNYENWICPCINFLRN